MKKFNVTGICVPDKDYMVDISDKIAQIKKLIDDERYFAINRARQYGKTTTLYELRRRLSNEYLVIKISFEGLGDESFASAKQFCPAFLMQIVSALESPSVSVEAEYIEQWAANYNIKNFDLLSRHITKMCKGKKIVLLIDEVDRTSNNRVFLHFLSMLRKKFLARQGGDDYTFHSVILAGVYDIKNIKLKMLNEGIYEPVATEGKIYNSPWNIAANFDVDMSFNPTEISTMLSDYESDHKTGMDITEIAEEIYKYTSGYPFLVSRICQCIDEELGKCWSPNTVRQAVQKLLSESNTLFDDVIKNLKNDKELNEYVYDLLILGKSKLFMIYDSIVETGVRYGFFKKIGNGIDKVAISNKIFELLLTNYFIAKDLQNKNQIDSKFHNRRIFDILV
ncbi:MAG: AAA-like domain-containing protein [Oscillospiraceae bacterium]|nr:AAA-like domain-containing protein [Oscillospiraceae bacterium]